jgi:hypothetical protein
VIKKKTEVYNKIDKAQIDQFHDIKKNTKKFITIEDI